MIVPSIIVPIKDFSDIFLEKAKNPCFSRVAAVRLKQHSMVKSEQSVAK